MNTTHSVLIIAEAGVNHNGDLKLALSLIDAAADAGADVVKFQTFSASGLVTKSAVQADYQVKNLGSDEGQFAMLKRLELSEEMHLKLIEKCNERRIRFLSTPFDLSSVDLLKKLGVDLWKIPSGEITNLPLLRKMGSFGQKVILSTGMSTLGDVEQAIFVLENAGTKRSNITVLHCTTEYPAPIREVNLRAMSNMAATFGVSCGYSDHTPGIEISIAAAAMGATVIEKHFTLSRDLPGPDHVASLEPGELAAMVSSIRNVCLAMGDGVKIPSESELRNKTAARKSIVAAIPILEGDLLTDENLTTKRPGTGLSPMRWDEVVGTRAVRSFKTDETITLS